MTNKQHAALCAAIATQLRSRRLLLGHSVAHVSRESGVCRSTITDTEQGDLGNAGTLISHMSVLGLELRAVRVRG